MAELLSQEPAAAAALLSILAAAMRPEGADVEVCAADYAWSLAAQGWRQQAIFTVCNLVLQVTLLPHSRHALSALHFVHATLCTQPFHAYSRQLAAAAAYFEGSRSGGSSGRGGAGSNGNGTGSGSGGGAGSGSGSGAGSSSGGGTGSGSGSWPASGSGGGPGRAGSSGHVHASSGSRMCGPGDSGPVLRPVVAATASRVLLGSNRLLDSMATFSVSMFDTGVPIWEDCCQTAMQALGLPPPSRSTDKPPSHGGRESSGPRGPAAPKQPATLLLEVAAERVAIMDKLARGLAESGFLEHVARLALVLQARHPDTVAMLPRIISLWWLVEQASGPRVLLWEPPTLFASASSINPSTIALLRSALGGRSVQTAMLVYAVGMLRVAERGPWYGLPAELRNAGLVLASKDGDGKRCVNPEALALLLYQLAYADPPSVGPGASLQLALRVGSVALGTVGVHVGLSSSSTVRPPPPPVMQLQWGTSKALQLAVGALTCGRLLLPRQRPLPQLEAQREEWWRLAVCAALYGLMKAEGYLQQLWGLVTAPLLAVWPNGVLDLDALPPAAPPEVAAALAGELPLLLCSVLDPDYSTRSAPLITACERARPDGSGLALFLTPLLAYGEEGQCNLILRNLAGLRVGAGTSSSSGPYEPASKFLYHDAPEAIRRCRGLAGAGHASAAGAEQLGTAAAGSSAARSAAVGPPPRHLHNFRWRLEGARELWAVPSTTGMRVVGSASAPPDPASAVASLPAAAPSASARQAAACACTSAALGRLQELSLRATEILRCARAHLASADETLKGGSGSATFRGAASAAAAEQRATAAVVGSGAAEMPLGLPLGFGQPRALTEGMWEEALPVSSPGGGGVLSSVAGASPGVDAAADGPMAAAAGSSSASASASPAARERLLGLSPGCQSSVPKAEHDQAQGPPWEILTKVKACGAEVLQTEETKMKLVAATRDLLASLGEAPEELDDTVALHRSGNGAFSLKVRDMVTTGKVEEVLAMCAVQVDEMVAKPVPDVEDAGGAACRAAPKGDSAGGGSSPAEVAAAEPCSAAAPAQVTAAEAGDGGAVAALDAEEARSAAAAAARIAPHALAGLRRGANPRVAVASPPLRVNLTRTHQTTSYTVGQVAVLAGPRCGANPRAAVASPPQTHAASAFARPAAACASASAALKRLLELSELATETMLWAPAQGSADEAPESGSSSADARGRAPSTAAEQPSTASPVTSAAGSGAVQAPLELPLRFGQPWALAAETARKALLVRSLGCGSATASAAGLLTGPAAEPPAASAGSASLTAASAMSSSATAAAAIASPTTPTAVTASCPSMATAATAARERLLGLSRGCQSSVPKAEHDQAHGALTEILTKVKACGAEVLQTEETKMKLVAATRDLLASLGEAPEELDDTVALNRSDDGAFSLKVRDMLTAGRVEEARALWTGQVEEVAAKLASVAERAGSSAGPPAAPKGQRAGGGATFGAVAADGAGGGTAAAAAVAMAAPQEHLGWFGALLWQAVWVLVVLGVSAALCMWGWV